MTKTDRLVFLDALRGLAALSVVLFHVMAMPTPALTPSPFLVPVLEAGATGVALFFVISAFSLCYTMPRHAATGQSLRSFYLHRFFRIAPLFYVWLAFSAYRDGRGAHPGHPWVEIATNLTFTFNLVPGWEAGIVWASWAIGVEMLFYAVFPLLFLWIRNLTSAVVFALCTVLASALAASGLLGEAAMAATRDYGLLRHLPVFAIGLCTFLAYTELKKSPTATATRRGKLLIGTGSISLVACIAASANGIIGPVAFWICSGVVYALLLVGMSQVPPTMIVNRFTAYLGKISYSIYLGHPVVIALMGPVFGFIRHRSHDQTLSYLLCALLTLLVTLPLAALTYRFIEAPAIGWGKRLGPKVHRSHPPATC
jgi:peptidoglycan/LPS O-acetylase OafA/YrhL